MGLRAAWLGFGFAIIASFVACKGKAPSSDASPVSAAPSSSPGSSASAPPTAPEPPATAQMPEGPVLAIEAGKGVGPIRLGATVQTIERLMDAPCEVKTPTLCRYIVRAVEFELKDGVTDRITVHRHERSAGPDAHGVPQMYGFFNGGIPPGIALGMVPNAVQKMLGAPQSVQEVTTPNDNGTVQRATYPGMVLEYDKYKNGNVLLGAVIIAKDQK